MLLYNVRAEVKVSWKGPERLSAKRIIADTALVGWYYDADATMVVPEHY